MNDDGTWRPSTIAYLQARCSPRGGFCFYRSSGVDHPNLEDTYCALRALALLDEAPSVSQQLLRFLGTFTDATHPLSIYYRAFCLLALKGSSGISERLQGDVERLTIAGPPTETQSLGRWLWQTRIILRLKRAFHCLSSSEHNECEKGLTLVAAQTIEDPRATLQSAWIWLDARQCCEAARKAWSLTNAACSLASRLQRGPAGFIEVQDSNLTSTDTILAGLRACRLLEIPVEQPQSSATFVLACQGRVGGFARSPGALPNIVGTYRAVCALRELSRHG